MGSRHLRQLNCLESPVDALIWQGLTVGSIQLVEETGACPGGPSALHPQPDTSHSVFLNIIHKPDGHKEIERVTQMPKSSEWFTITANKRQRQTVTGLERVNYRITQTNVNIWTYSQRWHQVNLITAFIHVVLWLDSPHWKLTAAGMINTNVNLRLLKWLILS